MDIPLQLRWLCDNESVVDTTKDGLSEDDLMEELLTDPRDESVKSIPSVLQSDWDVLSLLSDMIKQFHVNPEWIKSHQDKKAPAESADRIDVNL